MFPRDVEGEQSDYQGDECNSGEQNDQTQHDRNDQHEGLEAEEYDASDRKEQFTQYGGATVVFRGGVLVVHLVTQGLADRGCRDGASRHL